MKRKRLLPIKTFDSLRSGPLRIVTLSDRKAIVDGVGVSRPPIQQLPEVHASAGAPNPPPLPSGVPSGAEDPVGTVITVTTNSDVSDGDVSSVANLEADPGGDDVISLREAMQATNNDPDSYTIRFDPALDGATIGLPGFGLPPLQGGGVFINGDIDGDGRPDVTVENQATNNFGFVIVSSDNRLHAIAIRGFGVAGACVCPNFDPTAPTGKTYARNTIDDVTLDGTSLFLSGSGQGTQDTSNRLLDTRLVGNTIDGAGIGFGLFNTTGDTVARTTIVGNTIHVDGGQSGINVTAGNGSPSDNNLVSDVLLAYNSIDGNPEEAIRVAADGIGNVANVGNTVQDARVVANHIQIQSMEAGGTVGTSGILVLTADDDVPVTGDVARQIEVSGNLIDGYGREGIRVMAACCGGDDNAIQEVQIADNVLHGIQGLAENLHRGIAVVGSGGSGADRSTGNEVTDVAVRTNTVTTTNPENRQTSELISGGVAIEGGEQSGPGNRVQNVSVANNRVATELVGLDLLGGFAIPPDTTTTNGNQVSNVEADGNLIVKEPTLTSSLDPAIKALSVVGGAGSLTGSTAGPVTGNAVSCITLHDDVAIGVLNDASVLPNVGAGASGNTATLGGC